MGIGYTVVRAVDATRGRPIMVDVWYPAAATATESAFRYGLAEGRNAADADPAPGGGRPVVVLSHGAFGAARNYSWIAEPLAREGYVVAGVSHFGESYVHGPETIDPASATRPEARPPDCSFALDHLSGHPALGPTLDLQRVGALGHSSGGATVLALGGAVFDRAAMQAYCGSAAARGDRGCLYGAGGTAGASGAAPAPRSQRDGRIKAIVALDPALGPGHDAASLAGVSVPVHIVGAVDNDFLPFEQHAGRYARLIPAATSTWLDGGEGHFVFLDPCRADLEANGVPLCRDRAGVDRAAVHARLRDLIVRFFDRHLAPPPAPR